MSIYDTRRVKELAIKKMKEDLSKQGYSKEDSYFKTIEEYEEFYTLNSEEFELYMLLHNIAEDINEWTFHTSDTVYDDFIKPYNEIHQMLEYLSIDECLEEAKSEDIIKGFLELGNDLWLIKV